MSRWRIHIATLVLMLVWLSSQPAPAFYIQSPRTDACHERLVLGSFGVGAAASLRPDDRGAEQLFALFTERVERDGVPEHAPSIAFIDEVAKRFDFSDRSQAEKFVLASFVAGVRQPDTDGLSSIKFNETRSVHLQDENQPKHSLRRLSHDGAKGDLAAITHARQTIFARLDSAHTSWLSEQPPRARARWTFSFYGEAQVHVFLPAFQLGRAAHVLQDAYSHSLRDAKLQVVAIANFAEVIQDRYDERRDGPAHSKRLDECNGESSDFDRMRMSEAIRQNTRLLAAVTPAFRDAESLERLPAAAVDVLDDVYAYRPGCNLDNDYCGSHWLPLARRDLTQPYELSLCTAAGAGSRRSSSMSWLVWMVVVVVAACALRSRSRRSTA